MEGLQHHVRQHVALAQEFASWVAASSHFELAAPRPLNLVCFRHTGGDDFNRRLLDKLNHSGFLYLSQAVLDGKLTLRLCVGQTNTERRHVQQAWDYIQDYAADLQSELG